MRGPPKFLSFLPPPPQKPALFLLLLSFPISNGREARTTHHLRERTFRMNTKATCKSFASSTFRLQIGPSGPLEIQRVNGDAVSDTVEDSIRQLSLTHYVPSNSKAKILRDAVFTCSAGKTEGYLVLMPLGGMQAENAGN